MNISWTVQCVRNMDGKQRYNVVPKMPNGDTVRQLVFSDTNKPCMLALIPSFEVAMDYARKCQREMPTINA